MIKLHKSLCDVTLVPVETRSRRRMYRVDVNGKQFGFVEKIPDSLDEKHPWKAFRGIGVRCDFIEAFYPDFGGINAAVACVLGRALGVTGCYELA